MIKQKEVTLTTKALKLSFKTFGEFMVIIYLNFYICSISIPQFVRIRFQALHLFQHCNVQTPPPLHTIISIYKELT